MVRHHLGRARRLQSEFGDFVSPRVSVLLHPTRCGRCALAATGVYAPTPLTDETETFGLRYVDMGQLQPEHAQGWSLDVDGTRGSVELRASGYRTVVTHPLAVRVPPGSAFGLEIMNADLPSRFQGADVSARWHARGLGITAAYSYVDAVRPVIGTIVGVDFEFDTSMVRAAPYTPHHSARLEAALGRADDQLVGLEVRFTGRQTVADSSLAPSRGMRRSTLACRSGSAARSSSLAART